jgi:hypothetical protein
MGNNGRPRVFRIHNIPSYIIIGRVHVHSGVLGLLRLKSTQSIRDARTESLG